MKSKFNDIIRKLSKKYRKKEVKMGLDVEREHDNVTKGNPKLVGKIAAAHLDELPDYYTRLKKMEKMAD